MKEHENNASDTKYGKPMKNEEYKETKCLVMVTKREEQRQQGAANESQ